MEHHFENYAKEGNNFLKRVAAELGAPDDTEHAFRVLQAVFYTIRDRITPQESLHFISELPMAVKAMYVNNWKIHDRRKKYETKAEFLNEIYNSINTSPIDFGSSAEEEVQRVFKALKQTVSEGELEHVRGQLTPEIAELLNV